jgi:lipoic acid synthetase
VPAGSSASPLPVAHRLPEWIRVPLPSGQYPEVRDTLEALRLTTVCREARCPNKSECWSAGTATFMLLGATCSRRCAFCAVQTRWSNGAVDATEPERVAEGVRRWGLRYAVLTQVCRDDLADGGAEILAETVRRIHATSPATKVELLIGDLGGRRDSLAAALAGAPEVLAHNIETVRRLSPSARDRRAGYDRSLAVLGAARELGPSGLVTKSSIMLGLGETREELAECLNDLRTASVDLVTFGQYLRPTADHLPVVRYVAPGEFDELRDLAIATGFAGAEAGPLVRSSYHAEELFVRARHRRGA